jgi:hypothetical protein
MLEPPPLSEVGTVSTPSLIWPANLELPSPALRGAGPRPSELGAGQGRVRGEQGGPSTLVGQMRDAGGTRPDHASKALFPPLGAARTLGPREP